jgi:hypothetical protein
VRSARCALACVFVLAGCQDERTPSPVTRAPAPRIRLTDVTAASGVRFVHDAGRSPDRRLPETMGSGVAVFDADGDGLPELAFADFGSLDAAGGGVSLWRNLGGLRFAPVAPPAGVGSSLHAMGLAVADWDGDSRLDLLVTGVGGDELWLGREGLRFERAGRELFAPPPPGLSSSAAFFDLDGAGRLDLVVGRYVEWSRERDLPCRLGGELVYCTPEAYPPVASRLLLAAGGGLADATAGSALAEAPGKALGVAGLDVDADGRVDVALAHDTMPNQLFLAREGGFVEEAWPRGFAVGASGVARGGMGIAAGDLDGDLREDLVVANFAREAAGLFLADASGNLRDAAAEAGIGLATHLTLGFGLLSLDLDLDGALDLVVANGHIEPEIARLSGGVESWAQPLQVFRNRGDGRFDEIAEAASGRWVGRGLAAGDLDGDGDLDLVLSQNGGPAAVFRNDSDAGRALRVRLAGREGNRKGIGAWLELERADGARLGRRLDASGSYLSAGEPVVTFGLGASAPRRLVVRWPSGRESAVTDFPADGGLVVSEP